MALSPVDGAAGVLLSGSAEYISLPGTCVIVDEDEISWDVWLLEDDDTVAITEKTLIHTRNNYSDIFNSYWN